MSIVDPVLEPVDPVQDPDRLAAVVAAGLLDCEDCGQYDELAAVAAKLLDAPLAFLTVVDEQRSFWAGRVGIPDDGPRQNRVEESFCQYVIRDRAPLIIGDTLLDERVRNNPSVTGLGVRAWAGYPLTDPAGLVLGSFCVVDTVPRAWTDEQVTLLGALAKAASAQVSLPGTAAAVRQSRADAANLVLAEARIDRRFQQLAAATIDLATASSMKDLAEIILDRALPAIGSAGGGIAVWTDLDRAVIHVSADLEGRARTEVDLNGTHPLAVVARTGQPLLAPTPDIGRALSPDLVSVYEWAQRDGWAFLPIHVAGRRLGALAVSWRDEHECDPDELRLLSALAAQCGQFLDRLHQQAALARRARASEQMLETLQRSLLTSPPAPEHLQVAVRYQPAAREAQIGGDWYDAFVTATGHTLLTVGDVTGHDQTAAAVMGQLRNLLRGLAYDSNSSPAALLTRLDHAIDGLEMPAMATAIIAEVEVREAGCYQLRFASAGHPPPLLWEPDGAVQVLDEEPELLLGWDPGTERHSYERTLAPGSKILLYTDGLIEKRDASLSDGIEQLSLQLQSLGKLPAEELADALLAPLVDTERQDDIALLVLECHPRAATPNS